MVSVGVLALGCLPQADPIASHLSNVGFSGSVLVVHADRVLLRAGIGLADRELGVPNSPELTYRIGSVTKPITASGVLHAVERGRIELDDSVCDYIRNCPRWDPVKVRHLLNHTSGIPDLFGSLPAAPVLRTTTVIDSVVSSLGSVTLKTEPGTVYSYSNFNYMLAGYVLEEATGSDWDSYLRENVLEPAGATRTRYDNVWEVVEGRVHGYEEIDGRVRPIDYHDHAAYAAGGLHSTIDDLRAWHEAFRGGEIVSMAAVSESVDPGLGSYGLGWQVIEVLGRELQNHTGGIGGFSSHLAWYPVEELLIILLSNVEDVPVKALACDVARLVFGVQADRLPEPAWATLGTAERCGQRPLEGD
jgi:CubicO group peptidase (beta-lactamase class C family)